MATVSSREFNQAISQAKKAALDGPLFITDRGRSAYVLMTIERYEQLLGNQPSILDLLADPDCAEIEFEPPRLRSGIVRPPDLS